MSNTEIGFYFFISACALIVISHFSWKYFSEIEKKKKENETKGWKVGDKLSISSYKYKMELKRHNQNFGILRGWTDKNLYIEIGDSCYKVDWGVMDINKSALWRQNFEECKTYMGTEPGFSPDIDDNNTGIPVPSDEMIDGVPIECLSETLCEVHLKRAIEEQNFKLAALLRKRMDSFR